MAIRSYSGRRAASSRALKSTIRGSASFRRLLRRIPDATRLRLVDFLTITGKHLADIMGGRIRISGKHRLPLRLGVSYKVLASALLLKVGLIGRADQRRYFYGHILDRGRRAQIVNARRRVSGKTVSTYTMKIRAMPARNLEARGLEDFRDISLPGYRKLLSNVLLDVGAGAGND